MNIRLHFNQMIIIVFLSFSITMTCAAQNQSNIDQKSTNRLSSQLLDMPLGKPVSAEQFKRLTQRLNRTAIDYDYDFCVGMMDDREQTKSYSVIDFRQYQTKYLIEKIIFDGPLKEQKISIEGHQFDRHSTPQQLKKIKAEIQQNDDNDVVEDRVTLKKYPVTQTVVLRFYDSDDLIKFYFNQNKIVSIQYVVQC